MRVETAQEHLNKAFQATAPGPGWFLAGWVVVAEWVPPTGDNQLSLLSSPGLTPWARTGYLHDALDWDGYVEAEAGDDF